MTHPPDRPRRPVRPIEQTWIPVGDGTRLAARMWLPEDAAADPVPAVLEYLPYRKRDGTRTRDEQHLPYLAAHGYAGVRVDLRGSGDSDGVLRDEYLEQELADGEDVIAWLAAQPWCDGTVATMGISWGGFNGLQLAARRPEALRTVIAVAATDDRYADDVHYMGGCLLGDNLSWASTMFAYNSLPPDPELRDDWREVWHDRLEGSGLWLETWLEHQHRDDYWRHGSICEDFRAVDVPVMIVSGWADGYTNAVFRILAHLGGPRMGLVGPWSHRYPHIGQPGPAIGWLQECVRWLDRWCKGVDNDVERAPMLRAWVQDPQPPFTSYTERPGRWVAEPSWPSPHTEWRSFDLAPGRLLEVGTGAERSSSLVDIDDGVTVHSPLSLGLLAGKWCSYADAPDLPGDQQLEDGGALVFDTAPLTEDVEILGAPVLELELASDVPVAMVAVRLGDVRPDGQISRLTYGLLNLTHRDGHADPRPLVPGERVRVAVRLNHLGQRIPAGHRLRVAVSTSYWPLAWLPPEPVHLTVHPGRSRFRIPVRPIREEPPVGFGPPEMATPRDRTVVARGESAWRVLRDLATDEATLEVISDRGAIRIDELDLVVRARAEERYSVTGHDPTSAMGETVWWRGLERPGWRIDTTSRTTLSCTERSFRLQATLEAAEDGEPVHRQEWDLEVPRRLV